MALSDHISDIITATKALPNSHRKNKLLSKLDDALVHAKELERQSTDFDSGRPYAGLHAVKTNGTVLIEHTPADGVCDCPEGAMRPNCPIHGSAAR